MFGFFKKKKVDPRKELLAVLGDRELPSFPAIIMQALAKLRHPDSAVRDVSDIIASDPGLSVRLLKTVNSAAFALRRKVDSVQQASVLLGKSRVESLLLSVAVKNALPNEPDFDTVHFWRTSARRAATARALAKLLHPATQAESFSAALLQDMAVPMLFQARKPEYKPVLEHHHNSEHCLTVLERPEFGWDHTEVATWMAAEWAFPELLASAIGGHHGDDTIEPVSPAAVKLVSGIRDPAGESHHDEIIATIQDVYGVGPDAVVTVLTEGAEQGGQLAQLFL
jgi:HD-like signal output (HDOD) protein